MTGEWTSSTGAALMLAMSLFSFVFAASFWQLQTGVAATAFFIVTLVYLDRHMESVAADDGDGREGDDV